MKRKETLEITRRDLKVLVHWASVGVDNSLSGYRSGDAIEIINFHRSRAGQTRNKPVWGSSREVKK